tara:strand:+ start:420 stop:758 length:339 start_codon:yes stop_codon:yes gene_type:complete
MTTVKSTDINYNNDLPAFDFSNDKSEVDEIKEAIEKAEAAMSAPSADKPLVPTKKAAKLPSTKRGKAGRIVGISKGENELLQNLLSKIADDANYAMIVENEAFAKIQARYNK